MEIVIDISHSQPVFNQLIIQIREAIQANQLKSGDPLPAIRQLANDLGVNHNTVAKAYRIMERDGLILTRGYRGTVVHPEAKANSQRDLNAWIRERVEKMVEELRDEGATDSEIRIAFTNVMKK